MHKPVLSKSSYIRGLQCFKSLYLYKKNYKLRDYLSPEQLAKFKRGSDVGILAQQLFPGGKVASSGSFHYPYKNVEKTKHLIDSGSTVIYEAAFIYNDVYIALDILAKTNNNTWVAYEVKSSLQLSETYYNDAALQHYVITQSGLPLEDFVLIHIHKNYVRHSRLEVDSLFAKKSVIEFCQNNLNQVAADVDAMKLMLEAQQAPDIAIGLHCHNPYPCDFSGFCRSNIPKSQTIFNLVDFPLEMQYDCYHKGIVTFEDISGKVKLNEKQRIQIEGEEYCDVEKLKGTWFPEGKSDAVFVDILCVMPAVPLFEGSKPYQVIPFLATIIETAAKGEIIRQCQHFSEPGIEQRKALFELLNECTNNKRIFTFNSVVDQDFFDSNTDFLPTELKKSIIGMSVKDLKLVFNEMVFFSSSIFEINDAVLIANKLSGKRGNKPVFQSEILASEAYQSMFYTNDIFETVDLKEKLLSYSLQRATAIKDIAMFLHYKTLA